MAEEITPLFERPREDFLNYIREGRSIGTMDQEQEDFLKREYARVNSLTGSMETEPEEGRRSVLGGFFSKPEGALGWDALRGLRFEPKLGAAGVAQGVEQAVTAPARAAQGLMPESDMAIESFGTASLVGGSGVARAGRDAGRVDEEMVNIFGGRRARGFGYDQSGNPLPLSVGKDALDRFEIDDSGSVAIPGNLKSFNGSGVKVENLPEIADVFIHDELFYQYPQITSIRIGVDESLAGTNTRGYFQPGANFIGINPKIASDPQALRSTLTHELQHFIQEIEGFSRGTSPDAAEVRPISAQLYWEHQNKIDEYQKQLDELVNPESVIGILGDATQVGLDVLESFGVDPIAVIENPGSLRQNYNVPSRIKSSYSSLISSIEKAQGQMSPSFEGRPSSSDLLRETQGELDSFIRTLATETDPSLDLGSFQEIVDSYRAVYDKYGVGHQLYNLPLDQFKSAKRELETALANALGTPERPESFFDSAYEAYRRKGGEAEARNAQTRIDFDEQQRFRESPESTEDVPRIDQWGIPGGFAKGGLVTDSSTMSDYFKASSGMMSEMDFVGKHKMSTAEFERKFEEENNIDISGAEALTEIKGDTMKSQMKQFNQGGMAVRTDPISGNEVPTGSLPEEVRDDVPAMLSEGEYVIPADVVRYFGVNFFEGLREKAKEGLSGMAADGRVGGQPVGQNQSQEQPQLSQEDMQAISQMAEGGIVDSGNIEGIIDRVLNTVKTNPDLQNVFKKKGIMMAEGGLVDPQGSFNPADWSVVGSGGVPSIPQGNGGYEYKEYVGPNGQSTMVLFVNGMPTQSVPQGFVLAGTQQPTQSSPRGDGGDSRTRLSSSPRVDGQGSGDSLLSSLGNPLSKLDFQNPEDVMSWAEDRLKAGAGNKGLVRAGMAVSPIVGLLGAGSLKAMDARRIAEVNAAAMAADDEGNTTLGDKLRKAAEEAKGNFGLSGIVREEWMDGDKIYDNFRERSGSQTQQALTPTTTTRSSSNDRDDLTTRSTSGGVEYQSDADSEGAYSRSVATGSTAPTTSARPTARPTAPQPEAETIEQKISRGGGFKSGGLVTRRK